MSKILPAAKCSQMTSPKAGTGQGGDRCVEATLAMVVCTYKIGGWSPDQFASPETIMYKITEDWNSGSDTSTLQSGSRIAAYIKQNDKTGTLDVSTVSGTFANVQQTVDRGHISYGGVRDYRAMRLLDGSNPYQWNPANEPGPAGHVFLIVGYGDGVVLHDPLRGVDYQPAEYSVTSLEDAGWDTVAEILAPRLDNPPPPQAQYHIIQPGETFWALADFFYGDPHLYPLLEEANPQMNPRMLHIGETMTIPPKPAPGEVTLPPNSQQYTIVAGDTFWGLAERFYGDGRQYTKIAAANPELNPNDLQIGTILTIPA